MAITIMRQHHEYELHTSKSYQTTIITTIKYGSQEPCLFLVPAKDILEDLEIKDSQGKHLTVLSDDELLERFGTNRSKMTSEIRSDNVEIDDTLELIPILCEPSGSDYEKIFITYTVPIKESRYALKRFSTNIEINFKFKILPYEMLWNVENYKLVDKPFEMHVMVKVGEDYKINGTPVVYVYPDGDQKMIGAKESRSNTFGYYVGDMKFGNVIVGSLNIGLTDSLLNTARIISGITMFLPFLLVGGQIWSVTEFTPTLELLGGSIALLIGERFWVLKDRYIMRRWIKLQYGLIILNGFAFGLWFVLLQIGYISSAP